jgi:ankyrin repeat protein
MKLNRELFEAIEEGDRRAVRRLLAEDPRRATLADRAGSPPLLAAVSASARDPEVVEALLAVGADARVADRDGANALHYSISGNGRWADLEMTLRVFRALLKGGAKLEQRQGYGWTPLMAAIMEGLREDVEALLALGAKIEVDFPANALPAFTRGRTLLAESTTSPEKLELMLRAGADPNRRDAAGRLPIEVARDILAETSTDAKSSKFRAAVTRSIDLLEAATRGGGQAIRNS